jgi:3-dehydroquinate synthase
LIVPECQANAILVDLPAAPYVVDVGVGLLGRLDGPLARVPHARKAVMITAEPIARLHGDPVRRSLAEHGIETHTVLVPDGEEGKTLPVAENVLRRLARIPLERTDLVIALGGGAVGDLAGFVAATWHRGVSFLQVPTTLVAQVDAAIGGKTAVNLPEGKNLVGAFHQPIGVVADIQALATLSARDIRSGLAEVAKYGFIDDAELLEILENATGAADAENAADSDAPAALAADRELLTEIVTRSARSKARLVVADERESGERVFLNYGHTFGHVVETLGGFSRYRHGEAVAIGLVFAARLGERIGVSPAGLAERTVRLLHGLGLPTGGVEFGLDAIWEVLRRDKKARDGIRFVLCTEPGRAELVSDINSKIIDEVITTMR